MSDKKLTNEQKKELAKLLYTRENITTQKVISERVGVSQNTVSKWVKEGNWERIRTSIVFTKDEQLRELYDQFTLLNEAIRDGVGYPDSKQADVLSKLTKSISQLETETGIHDAIDVGMKFIVFVQSLDLELSKSITVYFDNYLKMLMNESK